MITQEQLDDDQAFWCNMFFPEEFLNKDEDNKKPLESYRMVIIDFSDNIKPVKINKDGK